MAYGIRIRLRSRRMKSSSSRPVGLAPPLLLLLLAAAPFFFFLGGSHPFIRPAHGFVVLQPLSSSSSSQKSLKSISTSTRRSTFLFSLATPPPKSSSFTSSPKENGKEEKQQQQQQPLAIRRFRFEDANTNQVEPIVAVVGRPNVGKSALVNRLSGVHVNKGGAIVADESGITRDRTYRQAEFLGEYFQIVDTGGLVFDDSASREEGEDRHLFAKEIRQQAMIALDESAAVILVVDGQVGVTNLDLQIAQFLRKDVLVKRKNNKIPVLLAVNKCESEITGSIASISDFYKLGLGQPHPVSALHGVGTAELLESLFESMSSSSSSSTSSSKKNQKSSGGGDDTNRVLEKDKEREGTSTSSFVFGTKAQRLVEAKKNLKHKGPLPWEDETDYKMRKYGIGDPAQRVLDEYEAAKAAFSEQSEDATIRINVAIIGRPNVGKSSLLNALFGEERAIVSDVAGTTRDSIDAFLERPSATNSSEPSTVYRFVDTAGIRRRGKVDTKRGTPEYFMVHRALRAMRRSDVVLLVLDATQGVTEQDRILAQRINDDGRACVVLCNKWDAVANKQDPNTYDKAVQYVKEELSPLKSWAPILFLSAATGQRVPKIFCAVDDVVKAHRTRIATSVLNEVLRDAIMWQPPPTKRSGAQAKIYYCHQVSTRPPTIVVFCNDPKLVGDNYRRYLDRKFRESLGQEFAGTPIRWLFRGRRQRDILRSSSSGRGSGNMNGAPGDGGSGTSFPFPHAD